MSRRDCRITGSFGKVLFLSFVLAAFLASAVQAQSEAWKRIESEYMAHHWRFGYIRTFRDHADLAKLKDRLEREVAPDGLGKDEYTEYLCLRHLIERAFAEAGTFERIAADPGMVLPTGDVFHRALHLTVEEGSENAPETRMARYFEALAKDLDEAPARWGTIDRRHAGGALKRSEGLRRQIREGFLLLEKNLPPDRAKEWAARGRSVLEALDRFRKRLGSAREGLPEPTEEEERAFRKKQLDFRIRHDYLFEEDSDALLRRGARFFLDTERELEAEARRIDPSRSWKEILVEAEEDHPLRGGIVELARRESADAMRFAIEKDLVTVPDFARRFDVVPGNPEGSAPFAQYRPAGRGREGAFVAVPCGEGWDGEKVEAHLRANNRHWMRAVALHEAVPGHHLQFSVASKIDRTVRRFCYCTSYVEGWGLYCEEMMAENGFFEPKGRLNQLRMKLWRAVRVLNSVGMNHRGLSPDDATAFMVEHLLFKEMHAKKEAEMHRTRPAYFCGYSIGFWQIRALRNRMRREWGDEYSAKRFHDALLSFGPIPIPIIEKVLTRRPPPGK